MPARLRHAMIDLETMGTKPDAAIVSIGAVLFDPRVNRVSTDTFYMELDWESQGRTVDPDTRDWWGRQSAAAQASLDGLDDLTDALTELAKWLPSDVKPWGNGINFDIAILENAYRQCGEPVPWKFWNIRDCRTIKDLYESARGGLDKKSGGTLHNALDDATFQAQYICTMWKSVLGGK